LHRLGGELLLSGDPAADRQAEEAFRRALEVARRQGAKSLELRAATSLARLGRRRGGSGEAERILADAHGWFSEGAETPDLREAGVLLGLRV
jgi:adenylate cyclase